MKLMPVKIMPNRVSLIMVSWLVSAFARTASDSSGLIRRTLIESSLYLALMLLLWGCTVKNPAYIEDTGPPSFEPDGAAMDQADAESAPGDVEPLSRGPDLLRCQPGAFISCRTKTLLLRCDETGRSVASVDCGPLDCNAVTRRCNECDPDLPLSCDKDELVICSKGGEVTRHLCEDGCVNNACVGCILESYYQDGDNDGYGDPSLVVEACQPPPDLVSEGGDCDDGDPSVHPAQTEFFSLPASWWLDYDYNCDGIQELELPDLYSCEAAGETCTGHGWLLYVPSCGQAGWHVSCVYDGWSGCWAAYSYRYQRCR